MIHFAIPPSLHFFLTGSHVAQAGLKFTVPLMMNLDSILLPLPPDCWAAGLSHHTWFYQGFTCASTLPTKLALYWTLEAVSIEQTKYLAIISWRLIAHPGPVVGTHFIIPAKVEIPSFHRWQPRGGARELSKLPEVPHAWFGVCPAFPSLLPAGLGNKTSLSRCCICLD